MGSRRRHGSVEDRWEDVEAQADVRGLLIARQLADAGLDARAVARRCAGGQLRRLARGVYAVGSVDGGSLQVLAAHLLAAGPGAFAHGLSASRLHGGLDLPGFKVPQVATPAGGGRRGLPRRRVPEEHIVDVEGLRTTDGLQTLLDLASIAATTGWLCGRFTWDEVVRNPTPTGRRLRELLEQGRRRGLAAG